MKIIYNVLGLLFFGIGAVGVILPILPTVPFLLVASYCFAKGSDRFRNWFLSTKIYKNNLESFQESRSMTMKTKLCILIPVTIMLLIAFFAMNNRYGRMTIVILLIIKYYYFIFRIKTIPNNTPCTVEQSEK